jgi:hypothetical protein
MTEPMSHEVVLQEAITELKAIREQWRSQLGGQDPEELKDVSQAIDHAIDRLASVLDQKEVLRQARKLGGLEAAESDLEGLPEDLR